MPSARHQLMAVLVPRLRKARELDDEPTERARVERWHRGSGPQPAHRVDARLLPSLLRRDRAAARRVPVVLPGASGQRPGPDRPLPARWRLHGADQRLAGPLRHAAGRRRRRPGRDARLPAGPRAHVARLPRRPGCARGAAGERGRARGRRRLVRRGTGPGGRTVAPRPRRPPAATAAPHLALGRPDHLHARDTRTRRERPVAVPRQGEGVRRLVGRRPRRPGTAGGQPRARRPGRPRRRR